MTQPTLCHGTKSCSKRRVSKAKREHDKSADQVEEIEDSDEVLIVAWPLHIQHERQVGGDLQEANDNLDFVGDIRSASALDLHDRLVLGLHTNCLLAILQRHVLNSQAVKQMRNQQARMTFACLEIGVEFVPLDFAHVEFACLHDQCAIAIEDQPIDEDASSDDKQHEDDG